MSKAYRDRSRNWTCYLPASKFRCVWIRAGFVLLFFGLVGLWGCGGSSSNSSSHNNGALAGNWQFTLTAPTDGSFAGAANNGACPPSTPGGANPICFGGFLLQNKASVSGQVAY